jgi:isocitrate/isopropylmalate dehydrogenase
VLILLFTGIEKCIEIQKTSTFYFLLAGNIETGSLSRGVLSRNVALRNELDLYINVLHCKSYPGVTARQKDIDIIIVRQNTEGEYAMLEHEVSAFI